MKIILSAIQDGNEDGFDGTVIITRDAADDLYSLANAFSDFARAVGYTYVNDVGFEKDDGSMTFGGF